MEKVDLTLSIEKMKLDALTYALSQKGGGTPQQALEQRFKELYEEAVAPELRGYIDYMIAAQTPRPHSKKRQRLRQPQHRSPSPCGQRRRRMIRRRVQHEHA